MYHDSSPGNDLLYGAGAIENYLGIPRRKAFYLIEQGRIPAGRLGREHIASKSALHDHFANLTRGGTADAGPAEPGGR